MRRLMMFGLLIVLGGCEGNTWWNPPLTSGTSPNMPRGDSINLRRITGTAVAVRPLTPEPGDIWPGPVPDMPTLQDLERDTGLGERVSSLPTGALPPHPLAPATTAIPAPPARDPVGRVVNTPTGQGVTATGTPGYQTTITPRGSAIIVPNANGTSTVIHPDGRIETIPAPR
jgi:hypothetical protein